MTLEEPGSYEDITVDIKDVYWGSELLLILCNRINIMWYLNYSLILFLKSRVLICNSGWSGAHYNLLNSRQSSCLGFPCITSVNHHIWKEYYLVSDYIHILMLLFQYNCPYMKKFFIRKTKLWYTWIYFGKCFCGH